MNKSLNLIWLYPEYLNLYGDRGNVLVLQKRCQWRGIDCQVHQVGLSERLNTGQTDLVLMGGGPDRGQRVIHEDFLKVKGPALREYTDNGGVGLFICGAYQLLGKYYQPGLGSPLEGLGVFDFYTQHFGENKRRCVGNIVVKLSRKLLGHDLLLGFENHGGRTYLNDKLHSLGKVLYGFGNNGEDGQEGLWENNIVGTYLHGPILPRNPYLADWLIQQALINKYHHDVVLSPLDDKTTHQARDAVLKRCHIVNR